MAMTTSLDKFNLKLTIATVKTTASSTIAITGIATEDTLIGVWRLGATAGAITDDTAYMSVSAAGYITNSTARAAGKYLVYWIDKSL